MRVSISTGAHEYPVVTTELRKMVKELVRCKSREWLQTGEVDEYPGAKPKLPRLAHSARLLRAMRYILPKRVFLAHRKAAPEPPSAPPSSVAASSQVEDGSAETGPRTNSFERNTAERPDSVPGPREAHDALVPQGRDT